MWKAYLVDSARLTADWFARKQKKERAKKWPDPKEPEDCANLLNNLVIEFKLEVPRIFLSHIPREEVFLYKVFLKKQITETDYI